MTVIDAYQCHCETPKPLLKYGQESGICESCGGLYDENLYEMRCRQYESGWHYDTVHDYLMAVDPNYRALSGRIPVQSEMPQPTQ